MKFTQKPLIVSCMILVLWVVAAPLFGWYLIVNEPLEKADIIFVLSGSAVYKERTKKAAELYAKGISGRIVLSDDGAEAGWSNTEERNPKFIGLEARSLIKHGVPPDLIIMMEAKVSGTNDEARALLKEARKQEWNSVVLVTSGYHSRRALSVFRGVFANTGIDVGIVSVPAGDRTPSVYTWWLSPRGWKFVGGEYLKTFYYWLFY